MPEDTRITLDEIDRGIILGALRSMASCLAHYNHLFDEGERAAYDQANEILKGEPLEWAEDARPEDDGGKWKTGG